MKLNKDDLILTIATIALIIFMSAVVVYLRS
jgi:hypothetical protein